MACDCDQLSNRLRELESRLNNLESCTGCGRNGRRRSGGSGENRSSDNDLIERVFRDKRWIAATEVLTFIIKGKV